MASFLEDTKKKNNIIPLPIPKKGEGYFQADGKTYYIKSPKPATSDTTKTSPIDLTKWATNFVESNIVPYANTQTPTLDTSGLVQSLNTIAKFNPFVSGLGSFYQSLFNYLQQASRNRPTAKLRAKTTVDLLSGLTSLMNAQSSAQERQAKINIANEQLKSNKQDTGLDLKTRANIFTNLVKTIGQGPDGLINEKTVDSLMRTLLPEIYKVYSSNKKKLPTALPENKLLNPTKEKDLDKSFNSIFGG